MTFRHLLTLNLLLTALLFSSCKKDKAEIDFGPDGGFQYRTAQNIQGPGDNTDWTADGLWNSRERQLFAGINLPLFEKHENRAWFPGVYPNPSPASGSRTFTCRIKGASQVPAGSRLTYVIVDKYYAELLRNDVSAEQNLEVVLGPNSLPGRGMYRLYYVFYTPGQQVHYRGHGDIKVE
jgi:hypothetical protein